jgi:hypothetical protein
VINHCCHDSTPDQLIGRRVLDWGDSFISRHSNDPEHLHSRAKARTIAERPRIFDAKRMMYEIVGDFERRAERAERRLADEDTGKSA